MIINTLTFSSRTDDTVRIGLKDISDLDIKSEDMFEIDIFYDNVDGLLENKNAILAFSIDGNIQPNTFIISPSESISVPFSGTELGLKDNTVYEIKFIAVDNNANSDYFKGILGYNIRHNSKFIFEYNEETATFKLVGLNDESDRVLMVDSYYKHDVLGLLPVAIIQQGAFNDVTNDDPHSDIGTGNDIVEVIHLPNTINIIDFKAFIGSENLKAVVLQNEVPPLMISSDLIGTSVANLPENFGFYVPESLVEIYKQEWNTKYIFPLEESDIPFL